MVTNKENEMWSRILLFFSTFFVLANAGDYKEPKNFDYSKLHAEHLMVLGSKKDISNVIEFTDADREKIVKRHNDIRSTMKVYKVLLKMRWDNQLAVMARGWASQCIEKEPSGQRKNLPMFDTSVNTLAIDLSQTVDDAMNKLATDGSLAIMRKQITPMRTSHIGCAMAKCDKLNKKIFVCVYGPRDLVNGRKSVDFSTLAIPEQMLKDVEKKREKFCKNLNPAFGKCDGRLLECNVDATHSDICYYGKYHLNMDTCQCTCVGSMANAGPKCAKILCENDKSNRDTSCGNAKKCEMQDTGARGMYVRYWEKCQALCNTHFKQVNCGQ